MYCSIASKCSTIERMVFLRTLYCIKIVCKSSSRIPVASITGTRTFSIKLFTILLRQMLISATVWIKWDTLQKNETELVFTLIKEVWWYLIHESISLYLRGDDVIRSHRRNSLYSTCILKALGVTSVWGLCRMHPGLQVPTAMCLRL